MDPVYFKNAVDQMQRATDVYAQALDDFIVQMMNLKSQVQDTAKQFNYELAPSSYRQYPPPVLTNADGAAPLDVTGPQAVAQ